MTKRVHTGSIAGSILIGLNSLDSARVKITPFIPCHRKYSQSEYRKAVVYSTVLPIMRRVACVASVSVGFGSKERPRNGIFGVLSARKMGLHFSRSNSLLPNPTETLATQAMRRAFVALAVLATVFSVAWCKFRIVMRSLVVCHGISHLSIVLGSCVYRGNTSDKWDIPWYTTRECCITNKYLSYYARY